MTLSPIFRSLEAVEMLEMKGYLARLRPSIEAERACSRELAELLRDVIDDRYIAADGNEDDEIVFLQEHFFLTLFDSVFRTLGCPADRLRMYGLLNLCVKGLVVAGDNLFDREAKMDLPLKLGRGQCFASIMQLICFDHLIMRVLERCGSLVKPDEVVRFRRDLVSALAYIGTLEGSEEAGVDAVLPVEEMIRKVHEVRGGRLFALSFIAPWVWEPADTRDCWETAHRGIARLGTAFQIVDDLVDFEFDLGRGSHNVLSSQIVHAGSPAEKAAFEKLAGAKDVPGDVVERSFVMSARAVLERARLEAERGFAELQTIGFWYPPTDADLFIRAIAGDAGDQRVDVVTRGRQPVQR
ncbi:MAG TPA: hypothetical protein VLM89_09840 [Phycisphaerae bacterium]|nr:hypothetical protein [Phycisphaerae bacterium]